MKELGKWLGVLSIFCLYQEIDSGYPYTDAVKYYLHDQPGGAQHYLRKSVIYGSKAPDLLDDFAKLKKAMTDEALGNNTKFIPETSRSHYATIFNLFKAFSKVGMQFLQSNIKTRSTRLEQETEKETGSLVKSSGLKEAEVLRRLIIIGLKKVKEPADLLKM